MGVGHGGVHRVEVVQQAGGVAGEPGDAARAGPRDPAVQQDGALLVEDLREGVDESVRGDQFRATLQKALWA